MWMFWKQSPEKSKQTHEKQCTQTDWTVSYEWMVTQLIMASHNEQWQWISTGVHLKSTLNHGLELLPFDDCNALICGDDFFIGNIRYAVVLARHSFVFFLATISLCRYLISAHSSHIHTLAQSQRKERKKRRLMFDVRFYFGRLLYSVKVLFYLDSIFFYSSASYECVCSFSHSQFTLKDMRFFFLVDMFSTPFNKRQKHVFVCIVPCCNERPLNAVNLVWNANVGEVHHFNTFVAI